MTTFSGDDSPVSRRTVLKGTVAGSALAWLGERSFAQSGATAIQTIATRIHPRGTFPVLYRPALPLTAGRARYTGFKPQSVILKKGTVRREGALPLPCDMVFERDVALKLRDGITIYTDVFRPVGEGKFPALVAWSPYGKQFGGQWLDDVPMRSGVRLDAVSELQKFEGPDPAYWVNHGYVILNPDPRGAYSSEGNINFWGRQNAEDGYDFIEWAARQAWSNGKIGLAGNSWLAISQWFIAAENPPHLSAIAPWEGFADGYRDSSVRGGVPAPAFSEVIVQTFAGKNLVEDIPRMTLQYPLMNPYWQDKAARLERIKVPAYVTASYTNGTHTHGTFAGYRNIASKDKWLRVHNSSEWPDFYAHSDDLRKFFDHYLKGEQNGWETTPRVRLSVLDSGGRDVVDRPEQEFPLARTRYQPLYLDAASGKLSSAKVAQENSIRYSVADGQASFVIAFAEETELTGYMNLRLWVSADGADDMDLSIAVEKVGADGQPFRGFMGMPGNVATGVLRVSHRAKDARRSTPAEPYLTHLKQEKLRPGEVVPVDIAIWPMGMLYHPGQQLRLTVTAIKPVNGPVMPFQFGGAMVPVPTETDTFVPGVAVATRPLGGKAEPAATALATQPAPPVNKGNHVIYAGGKYESYLLVPMIPRS